MKRKMSGLFYFPGGLIIFIIVSATPFIPIDFAKRSSAVWAKDTSSCLSALWPHEKSDLRPDPALIFGKLPNGFRYVMMKNHEPKDRVSIHLNVQAGSLYESDEQQGLAHYLEHMMFNGSEHFLPGELVKYFQSIGMSFGSDANAHTGFAEAVFDVLLPEGTEKSLKQGLLVLKDYARGALLSESEIERERGIILSEKRTRDSVDYRTYLKSMEFLFAGSGLSERMPIGKEEVIRKADRKLLKSYYDTWYRPENMILIMVGDFDPKTAEKLIISEYSDMTAAAPAGSCPDMGTVSHEGIKTFYHFEKEAGNTDTSINVVWNTVPKPDSYNLQKEHLAQYVADTIVNNRLEALTEKPDTPFTEASLYSGVILNRLGYAKLSAESSPENWKKVLSLLEQTLRQAIEFGFTESELERVRKDFLADMDEAVLKKDTRDSDELSGLIIENLNDDKVFQSPEQERDLYAPFVRSLTVRQVHEEFVKIWNRNHRLILVTGNAAIADKNPETVIRSVFDESAKTAVKKLEQNEAIQFPYLPEPETSGTVIQQDEINDLGITQITFENGVRLNLKKSDFKKNEVIAALAFGFGKKTEPVPGLAMLAEAVLNKSGLGGLSENELERALAGKNTSVNFNIRENCFAISGETLTQELPLLFQLLYAHLKDPGYRLEGYALVMRQFEQMYKELSHSVDGAMELSGNRFLAGGDSRFGMPCAEDFRKLTIEQIRSWIEPLRNDRLEITVAGDFDPETVRTLAARYFGSLPRQPEAKDKEESLNFPSGKTLALDVESEIHKGIVVLAWPTEDFSDICRVRRLSALGHVFNERLREEIREERGASYSQYAYNDSSRAYKGYGVLRSMLFIDPDMSEKIIQEVRRIAGDLAAKGITQDELRRAVDPILTGIKDMMRTNRYWLETVLLNSVRYPQQIEWSRTIQKDYAAITVQEISDLAKTYLKNEKAASLIIKPVRSEK